MKWLLFCIFCFGCESGANVSFETEANSCKEISLLQNERLYNASIQNTALQMTTYLNSLQPPRKYKVYSPSGIPCYIIKEQW